MFKISRLTDYGVVILCCLAERNDRASSLSSARDIAESSGLPLPTVSKLLKLMAKHGLITAKRGAQGGYELLEDPKRINLLRLIEIFEGPPALLACMMDTPHRKCQINNGCPQKNNWYGVHLRIAQVLKEISLFEMITTGKTFLTLTSGV